MEAEQKVSPLEQQPEEYRRTLGNILIKHTPIDLAVLSGASGVFIDGLHRDNKVEMVAAAAVASGAFLKHFVTVVAHGLTAYQLGIVEERLGVAKIDVENSEDVGKTAP